MRAYIFFQTGIRYFIHSQSLLGILADKQYIGVL